MAAAPGAAQDAGKSSGNLGCLVIIVVALLLFAWSESFWGLLDDYRDNPVVSFLIGDGSTGTSGDDAFTVPEGAVYIDFYDGVDHDTASEEEIFAGMDRAKEKLRQAFQDMETEIYLSSNILFNDTSAIPNDAFWIDIDEGRGLTGIPTGNGFERVWKLDIRYNCTKEERDAMQAQVDVATAQILALVPEGADVWTTSIVFHDELVRRISYDHTLARPHRGDIYGALVEGQATCMGYAKAFEYLMDKSGCMGTYVSSTYYAEDKDSTHAWNLVVLASVSDYIDVTWDDPDEYDAYGNPYILHDYCFLTADELARVDSHEHGSGGYWTDNDIRANYHEHLGYYMEWYDPSAMADIFRRQIEWDGANVLSVKFASAEAFEQSMTGLFGPSWRDPEARDYTGFWDVMYMAGHADEMGSTASAINEELYVLDVYLRCA